MKTILFNEKEPEIDTLFWINLRLFLCLLIIGWEVSEHACVANNDEYCHSQISAVLQEFLAVPFHWQ